MLFWNTERKAITASTAYRKISGPGWICLWDYIFLLLSSTIRNSRTYMNRVLERNGGSTEGKHIFHRERKKMLPLFLEQLWQTVPLTSTNTLCKTPFAKKKISSLTYSICLLTSFNFLNFIMLLFRPIYLSFCMGFSFWGGGGVDQHDSSYPEGRPTVVWIKSYGYRLVGQEYQHTPKVYWEGIFIAYKYSYVLLCSNRYLGWLV